MFLTENPVRSYKVVHCCNYFCFLATLGRSIILLYLGAPGYRRHRRVILPVVPPFDEKKKNRTPIWGCKQVLPPDCYTSTCIYTGHTAAVPHSIPSRPNQRINSVSEHSIKVARINLEHSQATASKHWSLPSVRVRVRVRVVPIKLYSV